MAFSDQASQKRCRQLSPNAPVGVAGAHAGLPRPAAAAGPCGDPAGTRHAEHAGGTGVFSTARRLCGAAKDKVPLTEPVWNTQRGIDALHDQLWAVVTFVHRPVYFLSDSLYEINRGVWETEKISGSPMARHDALAAHHVAPFAPAVA